MDEQEKAFVVAAIKVKMDNDKKEKRKLESKSKKKGRWWRLASIKSTIELYDQFSSPLMQIVNAVNQSISVMDKMNSAMNNPIDTSELEQLQADSSYLIGRLVCFGLYCLWRQKRTLYMVQDTW